MKAPAFLRTLLITLLIAGFGIHSAAASDIFRIVRVSVVSESEPIYVGKTGRKDLTRRIRVTLRTSEAIPGSGVRVKAYFYDKDKNVLHVADKPNDTWREVEKGWGWIGAPSEYSPKAVDVYFAITDELKDKKWKSVVVVFGKGDDMIAMSHPRSALKELDFEEAKIAKKE